MTAGPGARRARQEAPAEQPEARFLFPAEPFAIRVAIESVLGFLRPRNLDQDSRARVEIVLAEVLNNIAEHAYARLRGRIELRIRGEAEHLVFLVIDDGAPMPDLRPPPAGDPDAFPATLAEGGFGWFLIRSEVENLAYRRDRGRNRLSFRLCAR